MVDGRWQMADGKTFLITVSLLALVACSGSMKPVALTGGDTCAHCRMVVSNPHFAAQIVAPGEEPRIFDDIGCLAAALAKEPAHDGAAVFVADHRTGEWVPVGSAVFTRVSTLDTPMGSHLVAHATERSRAEDPRAAGGLNVTRAHVFAAIAGGR